MAEFAFVEDSFEEIKTKDFYDKVAAVAHNCYQVAEKGHEANVQFISRLIQSKHLAMIEHQNFLFEINQDIYLAFLTIHNSFYHLFSYEDKEKVKHYLVSCSLRPLLEATDEAEKELDKVLIRALPADVKVLFADVEDGISAKVIDVETLSSDVPSDIRDGVTYVTYRLVTDRGVTHEIVRHRVCSFAQESTRYCNYTKDKFSNTILYHKPLAYEENKETYDHFFKECTETYFKLIENGCRPDQARSVLPNAVKASIMVTCNVTEWKHIFELRTDPAAHEDIRRLMIAVKEDMTKKGYLG